MVDGNCCLSKWLFWNSWLLLKSGADINIITKNGNSALIIASYKGHKEIVKILLNYKADINQKDSRGENALAIARKRGYKEIEDILKNWKWIFFLEIQKYSKMIFQF